MIYKYLFGPVPSRRLGISLGIDLFLEKICSFNCVYCECNKTVIHTSERKEYTPTKEVITELEHFLSSEEAPEYVTFSGSGEPTLHNGIGKIIKFLKNNYPSVKVALLTNATMLSNPEVRKEILELDLVLPTLNGVDNNSFLRISRPNKGIQLNNVISGLIEFRKEFAGKIWLSYFVVEGINNEVQELENLVKMVQEILPDILQLNTLDRPGTESWVKPATKEQLEDIQEFLSSKLEGSILVEIISRYRSRREIRSFSEDIESLVLNTISRRPCTLDDLSDVLGLHKSEIAKYLDVLTKENKIEIKIESRGIFYVLRK